MKFSIITITYNRANLIIETIESILKQTYQNFELLIIDDGSTDHTEDVITSYQKKNKDKIQYIKSEKIGIPSKLRNIGLRQASGEIITILDSDDIWLEEKLEQMYNIFAQQKDVKFVIHNLQHFTQIDNLKPPFYNYKNSFYKDVLKEILICEILAFPIFSMRSSIMDEIGLFDEDVIEGQHDYYLKVATKYKIFYLNKSLTLMRRHENNYTKKSDVIHCLDAITSYDKLRKNNLLNKKQYQLASNFMNYKIAEFYFQQNEKQKGIKYLNIISKNSSIFSKWYLKSKILKYIG
ncbi:MULTISPECIES: glycosyltransferase family 2 protein [Aquimarina]|uniref:Glycosyltransferase n=1 Tax=Aquimarina algiphila TaxID=2047982 RepID=A0A554VQW3_9FLAO|nr:MULTISPECIES: glycosyltransferase [Aquimarina]TSE10878.1 glycosyltransferase [Aquimarina algiphila]